MVTGSSGHLGEALARLLVASGVELVGLDCKPSAFTTVVGSVSEAACVRQCIAGADTVFHTATLHKPHVATHSKQNFIDTNVTGTLVLLEEAVAAGVANFVFTSTTSLYGDALRPPAGSPAAWITEDVVPLAKNIYGATKSAAEDLCRLFYRNHGLNCIILRTSRFFPEEDDDKAKRSAFQDANLKANEFLFRRVELDDVVSAHIAANAKAQQLGFGRYIISATSPFQPEDAALLNTDAAAVVQQRIPEYAEIYGKLGWKMFDRIDRVYVNAAARKELGWQPKYDFFRILDSLRNGRLPASAVSMAVGSKGYHDQEFDDGPYPVGDS